MVIFVHFFQFPKNREDCLGLADVFEKKWNFNNCEEAIEGKHIRIVQPIRVFIIIITKTITALY